MAISPCVMWENEMSQRVENQGSLVSGRCKVLIFLKIWSLSRMLCTFFPPTLCATSLGFWRNRPESSADKMYRACETKDRPSKRLELYILHIVIVPLALRVFLLVGGPHRSSQTFVCHGCVPGFRKRGEQSPRWRHWCKPRQQPAHGTQASMLLLCQDNLRWYPKGALNPPMRWNCLQSGRSNLVDPMEWPKVGLPRPSKTLDA